MRELRYVQQADESAVVVETADGHERFHLQLDDALRTAVTRPRTPKPTPGTQASASSVGPREIQVRVRAGETPEELAESCGAGLDWVLRFAGPVLAERARIADEARRARARRSTSDGQPVVFGEAVDARFDAHGIEPETVRWDARRREDGQWVVSARWLGGDADREAQWSFALAARTVAPLDDTAADLLSDRPIRPLVPVAARESLSTVTAPPLAHGVVVFPAMADAHTGPLPRVEEVFDQEAFDGAFEGRPFDEPDPEPPAALFEEPALPLHIEGRPARRRPRLGGDFGTVKRPDETDDQRAARAHIPSWDDILLGVRRKND